MTRPADLAIWGRVPPPIGGMSVHIERLLPCLLRAGVTVQMYSVGRPTPAHPNVREVSHRRLRWLAGQMIRGEAVHYVFSDDTRARFAAACLSAFAGRAVILRVGGRSLERALNSASSVERWMIRFAIRRCTAVVGVNQEICDMAQALGAKRVQMIPGFIPPLEDGSSVDLEVSRFFRATSGPVVLGSGEIWAPEDDDLYGAYAFLDLLEAIPELRAVYYAYEISPLGQEPRQAWIAEIGRRGLSDRIFPHLSGEALWPAMRQADLMLRPTLWDGDSNAVREALSLGLPVVASDCVPRPKATVTFQTGDSSAMVSAVRQTVEGLAEARAAVEAASVPDNAAPIVELIVDMLQRRSGGL